MNTIRRFSYRTAMILLAGWLLGGLGVRSASAQSINDVLSLLQNLPSSTQQQLINQFLGGTGGTGETGGSTTTDGEGLPLGKAAINYTRTGSPGSQVRSANRGNPTPPNTIYPPPIPVEEPDFWDRVKEVFVESLFQAFMDVTGNPINIPTAKAAELSS